MRKKVPSWKSMPPPVVALLMMMQVYWISIADADVDSMFVKTRVTRWRSKTTENSNKIEQFLQFFNTNWASGHSPRWDLDAGGGGTPGVLQGQWQLPPPFIFLILLFLFSAYLHLHFSSIIHFAHSHTKRQNTQRQTFYLILPLFWFSWLSSPSTGGYLYLSLCKVGWRCS